MIIVRSQMNNKARSFLLMVCIIFRLYFYIMMGRGWVIRPPTLNEIG
jgi:hypothetical protein